MTWQGILKAETETKRLARKNRAALDVQNIKNRIEKLVSRFGKYKEKSIEEKRFFEKAKPIWSDFMKTKPSEEKQEELVAFFDKTLANERMTDEEKAEKAEQKRKQKQMKVIAEKQRKAREALGE
tara:strand:- start:5492 stop:5866 length:375 start_codon:yes stop_codon:yes gene_type:complete